MIAVIASAVACFSPSSSSAAKDPRIARVSKKNPRLSLNPWGLLFSAALIFGFTKSAHAQGAYCGATIHQSTNKLLYPPIARAAHVAGTIVLMVAFNHDGSVSTVRPIAGPELLRITALSYAKGLSAEPSSGSRECPFVMDFNLNNCDKAPASRSNGASVCTEPLVLSDPAFTITRKHRFLFF